MLKFLRLYMFLLVSNFAEGGAGGGEGDGGDPSKKGDQGDDPSKKGDGKGGDGGKGDGGEGEGKDDELDKLTPEEIKARLKQKKAELAAKEEKWKKDKEKLSSFEAAEKKAEEKKLKEKGEYETIISTKDAEIAALKEKADKWDAHESAQTESDTKKLKEIKDKVPKEILNQNESILEKLPLADQIKFLETITKQIQDFKNDPQGGNGKNVNPNTEYEKAVKDGNVRNALKHAPTKQ